MSLTKVTYSMIDGAPVNVLDYGATGDGVTDDTTAFQAAIDALSALGGFITVPSGNYNVTPSSLTVGNKAINYIVNNGAILPANMPGIVLKNGIFSLPETSFQTNRNVRVQNYWDIGNSLSGAERQYAHYVNAYVPAGVGADKEFRAYAYNVGTDKALANGSIYGIKGRIYADGGDANIRSMYGVAEAVAGSGFTGFLTGVLATVYTNGESVSEAVGHRSHMSDGSTAGFQVAGTGKAGETGAMSYGYMIRTGTGQPGMPTVAHYQAHGGSSGDMFLGFKSNTDTDVANAPFRVLNTGVTKTLGVYSLAVSINDDAVATIEPPQDDGFIEVYARNTSQTWGKLYFRCAGTPLAEQCYGGSLFSTGTGVPTGTTGADGDLIVFAANDGNIYIENRIGVSKEIVVLFVSR